MSARIYDFQAIREQTQKVMQHEAAYDRLRKALDAMREKEAQDAKTLDLMSWYGRHDKPEPPSAA